MVRENDLGPLFCSLSASHDCCCALPTGGLCRVSAAGEANLPRWRSKDTLGCIPLRNRSMITVSES